MRIRSYRDWAADGALLLGGGAAILLQLTDPMLAHSVARHSRFEKDPVGRLVGTLRYVYSVALGAPRAVTAAAGSVDRVHDGIPGADDPDRQLWVAATLYWAGSAAHDAVHPALPPDLADEVYARSARLGSALRMPLDRWPEDRAAFQDWWNSAVAAAVVSDDARRVARALLRPRGGPLWLRLAMPTARLVTVRMLPPRLRAAYGFRWSPALESRYAVRMRAIRTVWSVLPRAVREAPSRRLVAR